MMTVAFWIQSPVNDWCFLGDSLVSRGNHEGITRGSRGIGASDNYYETDEPDSIREIWIPISIKQTL